MLPNPCDLLPHRPPQLVLTRLVSFEGDRLVAEGDFGSADWQGAVPGMWLVEGVAQALGCLGRMHGEDGNAVLLSIEGVTFPASATVPCTLKFEVWLVDRRLRITEAAGRVTREGVVVCEGRVTAALLG